MSSYDPIISNINNLKEKKHNKIRKRGCSSSSSSTSLVRRYRFKRAILVVGKKGGGGGGLSSTPAPLWKTTRTTRSPPSSMAMYQYKNGTLPDSVSGVPSKDKELSVSARKLAATLWQINDFPSSKVKKELEVEEPIRSRKKDVRLSRSGLHMSSDPLLYSPFSERIKGFDVDSCNGRVSALSFQQLQLADYNLGVMDAHCSANLMEQDHNQGRHKKNCGKCNDGGVKNRMKEARNGLSTSKKLLKVLNQMCLQEQKSSTIPLILAMSNELDRVRAHIEHLILEQTSNHNDAESLAKHFAEEKIAWKRRQREKIQDAVKCKDEELEMEKKLRRQTERLNKKIAKELDDVKASYVKATEELEREKRAKEILEQICDELAKGIGEDKTQVEELKKESAKVREEIEMEREMLQFADALREERVQMKLSEAKYQFEEKNAVLERVKSELESFLRTKEKSGDVVDQDFKKLKDLESCLNNTCWRFQDIEKDKDLELDLGEVVENEDDSGESDLQSIELNILDNDNKSFKWSYACENVAQDDPKRVSIDRDIGRSKIQWGNICFNKKKDIDKNFKEGSDQFNLERSIEFQLGSQIQDVKSETESYRPMMSLLDCISCANPTQKNGEPEENALALEGHKLKKEVAGRKS
ncbi:hypothetical protein RIF29_27495 [Crotalaria pallida]|uniref:Uncharacterized protein n=1 Tax=Crotalaria pallida TaxID=3830 RepID=A0AAN9I2E6_CROPI